MRFKIPFTFSGVEKLRKRSKPFRFLVKQKKDSSLKDYLKAIGLQVSRQDYLAICYRNLIFNFIFLWLFSTSVLFVFDVGRYILYGFGLAFAFSFFIFFSQMIYPKIYVSRRQKNIEKNLLPALENILIQLTSGIPLFGILTNISAADYGVLSKEFKKAVVRINAGEPQADVLEDLGRKNPSIFFRRTLWQISNGMRAGSDMSIVIRDSIKALNEEQIIQIQNYGNKLNPIMLLYMLISVIVPALSITFLTILSSMLGIPKSTSTLMFVGLFVFVILIQIMFLGMIRSRRPSLL